MGRREKGISSQIFVANQGRRQELNVANTTRNTLERKGGSDTKRGEQTVKPRLNLGFGLGYHFVRRLRNTKVRLITSCIDAWKNSIISSSPIPQIFLTYGFSVRLTSAHRIIVIGCVKSSLRRNCSSVSLKPPPLQANKPNTLRAGE